jgi:hypothetical protein
MEDWGLADELHAVWLSVHRQFRLAVEKKESPAAFFADLRALFSPWTFK